MINILKSIGLTGSEAVYLIIAAGCLVLFAATYVLKPIFKKIHKDDDEYHKRVEERRLNARRRQEEENALKGYYSTAFMSREDLEYAKHASSLIDTSYEEDDDNHEE